MLEFNPSIDPELPVWDDNGVDVDEENGGDDNSDTDEGDVDNRTGLKMNKACLKPGLKIQS